MEFNHYRHKIYAHEYFSRILTRKRRNGESSSSLLQLSKKYQRGRGTCGRGSHGGVRIDLTKIGRSKDGKNLIINEQLI